MTEPLDNARGDWPPPFEMMKLQARPADGGDWVDIYPAQLEQMVRNGADVRAVEATRPAPVPQCEAEPWRCPHDMGFDNELGPLGCLLVSKSLECVCENHHFATPPSRSDASADSRCDAESVEVDHDANALWASLPRRALVPPPSEAESDYVLVPRELTAANGAKAALIGEFSETFDYIDDEGDECQAQIGVSWTTIKAIHKKMVAIFALSTDPGTVAVASAQYQCTCGAEPYCAPNVHAASCPLAVTTSTTHSSGDQ